MTPDSSRRKAQSARPSKPRAQDLDETLTITQQMKEYVESLSAKQLEAMKKMKDQRSTVAKLREQVNSMQSQIEAAQTDREASTKATQDLQGQLEKLENEHAVLHATHTWTKSSLDSALAAQEEYRKGYNSLRAAFKKAKEEIEKANEEIETHKNAQGELEQARTEYDERKVQWDKELNAVNATMQRIAHKHKDKAQKVLDRMNQGQASGLLGVTFAGWVKAINDWKHSEKAKAEVEATQAKLNAFQDKKTMEAKQFLNRMTSASDTGLTSLCFKSWLQVCEATFKERREAEKLKESMKAQKMEARKKLEVSLGTQMKNIQGVAFKNWAQCYREEKEERELKAQADAAMAEYKSKKKSQSMQVVGRMCAKKEQALLSQLVLLWKIIAASEVATRYRQEEARKRLETFDAEIATKKKLLETKLEELNEAKEELAEVKKKNQVMKQELQKIEDLEEQMEKVQDEIDKES